MLKSASLRLSCSSILSFPSAMNCVSEELDEKLNLDNGEVENPSKPKNKKKKKKKNMQNGKTPFLIACGLSLNKNNKKSDFS